VVRRLRFSGPKTSIICSPMTSLKTSIKTITYLSDIGCLEIQGASLYPFPYKYWIKVGHLFAITFTTIKHFYVSVYIILLYH
ncbi:hypothetical protein ACOS7S_24355, partial [Escherichia coli]|uniref:hypothetical protein n=1 Tax=Escherichia coli TaxID=562 RepID=UPI003BA1188A